jgi:hypothetical protein
LTSFLELHKAVTRRFMNMSVTSALISALIETAKTYFEEVGHRLSVKVSTLAIWQNTVVVRLSGRGPPVLTTDTHEAEAHIDVKVIAR